MKLSIRKLLGAAALLVLVPAPPAYAASMTVDFESSAPNLYFPGDSFIESRFRMTADFDAGIVDVASALGGSAPTGNATQFFTGLNDAGLIVERDDGGLFNLDGFSTAFVPLSPPSAQQTFIVAIGVRADNSSFGLAWSFSTAFETLDDPLDFGLFTDVKFVEFFACAFDGVDFCTPPTQNNGQFAIDDIRLSFVPEPATLALMPIFLLGLALRRRRVAR